MKNVNTFWIFKFQDLFKWYIGCAIWTMFIISIFPKDLGHFRTLILKTIPIWKCLGFTSFALSQLVGVCLNPRTPLQPTPFYLSPSFAFGPILYLKACNFLYSRKNTLLSFLNVGFKHNLGSLHILHYYHIFESFFFWIDFPLVFCNVENFGNFYFYFNKYTKVIQKKSLMKFRKYQHLSNV